LRLEELDVDDLDDDERSSERVRSSDLVLELDWEPLPPLLLRLGGAIVQEECDSPEVDAPVRQ